MDLEQSLNHQLTREIKRQQLPESFLQTITQWYLPIASKLNTLVKRGNPPLIIGINGGQGSGKSTLSCFLSIILKSQYGIHSANLSLDDFYLSHSERTVLAKQLHPLLQTRGVPGTHDIELLMSCLGQLKNLTDSSSIKIPRFDKACDDRKKESQWDTIEGPVQIILLEGWCVGATAQSQQTLDHAINELERKEDSLGQWRAYVNKQLADQYSRLWQQLDWLIMLKVPSFSSVIRWRTLQEQKLSTVISEENDTDNNIAKDNRIAKDNSIEKDKGNKRMSHQQTLDKTMSEQEIKRFVQYFERITEHCLETLPGRANALLSLDEEHQIRHLQFR